MGFDTDFLLKHSFQREIYAVPLARNFKKFLNDEHSKLRYYNYSLDELVGYWKNRWLDNRKTNTEVMKSVYSFRPEAFSIV